jgi:hypothetical protein
MSVVRVVPTSVEPKSELATSETPSFVPGQVWEDKSGDRWIITLDKDGCICMYSLLFEGSKIDKIIGLYGPLKYTGTIPEWDGKKGLPEQD